MSRKKRAYEFKDYPSDFEEFWKVYPRRVDKSEALVAWEQTEKIRPRLDNLVLILQQQIRYGVMSKDTQYQPYPSTWLRGRRWEDEIPSRAPVKGPTAKMVEDLAEKKRLRSEQEESRKAFEALSSEARIVLFERASKELSVRLNGVVPCSSAIRARAMELMEKS